MLHYRVTQYIEGVDKAVALCNPYGVNLTTTPEVGKVTCKPCLDKAMVIQSAKRI
jgi:hypothetical protein